MRFVLHINNRHTSGKWLKAANINLANINTTEMKNQKMLTNIKYRSIARHHICQQNCPIWCQIFGNTFYQKNFRQH
jgi:hypothetical protein